MKKKDLSGLWCGVWSGQRGVFVIWMTLELKHASRVKLTSNLQVGTGRCSFAGFDSVSRWWEKLHVWAGIHSISSFRINFCAHGVKSTRFSAVRHEKESEGCTGSVTYTSEHTWMASAFMSRAILGLYSCVLAVSNSNEILGTNYSKSLKQSVMWENVFWTGLFCRECFSVLGVLSFVVFFSSDLVLGFTHTVVAAPARAGFGFVAHLLQGFSSEVAQLPQATVVEHPRADPAGVKIIGRPHLAHIAHLVAWRLRQKW